MNSMTSRNDGLKTKNRHVIGRARPEGKMSRREFETALARIPKGYSEGSFAGRRYGVTLRCSDDGRRLSLFAKELGGRDVVSCNRYQLRSGVSKLRPCEMSSEKVEAFVLGFKQHKLV
jgi:hypothetical protein